jgi:isoleucyl-tRNA synthetase
MAPYRAVLTHGFVVDGEGRKMSKSLGNVISPQEIIAQYGAEILRLWVTAEDYRDDVRLSPAILQQLADAYRRFRNTIRFMLGNLADFDPARDYVPLADREELDRLALSWLAQITDRVRRAYLDYEFHLVFHRLHQFCAVELSAIYLDILKDRLYILKPDSPARRSAQSTLLDLLEYLLRLLAPILSFTAEEAWGHLPSRSRPESVHLADFPAALAGFPDEALLAKYEFLFKVRAEINREMDLAKKAKVVASAPESRVILGVTPEESAHLAVLQEQASDLKTLVQVEHLEIVPGPLPDGRPGVELPWLTVTIEKAPGEKCVRCWYHRPGVGEDAAHPQLCRLCREVLGV